VTEPTNRRRIDRIADGSYLDGIDDPSVVPASRLRELRSECEQEESGLSYARRVLQGRLDIVRAEVLRRSEAGQDAAADLLGSLPRILADDERPGRDGVRPTGRRPRGRRPRAR
jgi:hypothetical protein